MKKLITLSVFILLDIYFVHGQNKISSDLEVRYYMRLSQDSLSRENSVTAEMVLLCNKNNSYYFNPDMVNFYENLDKKVNLYSNAQEIAKNYIPTPKVRHSTWKEDNIITVTSPLGKYNYSYKSDEVKWEILSDIKKIENFSCQLGKTEIDGDVFYAWYTNEIPFSEGPFKFKGLPGLILKLYNKNHTIEIDATNVAMKKVDMIKMNEPLNMNLKNRNAFLSARKEYFKNPFSSNISKEKMQRKLDQLKKINVFLD